MPSRRSFLSQAAGGALAGIVTPVGASAAPGPAPVSAEWDMAWVDRVRGDHRAVFDNAEPADGFGFVRAALWPRQVTEVYGVDRQDITSVLVLRHNAIPFVMQDDFWRRYGVGKRSKVRGADGKWASANPIATSPADAPPPFDAMNLPAFIAGGGIVLACYLAFQDIIFQVASREKLDPAAAEAQARSLMLPGIILQPSGFFAVLRAQQAGCHYMLAG